MANDSKISGLPVDSSPTYNDLVPVVSGNTTSQITTGNLVTAGSVVNPSNNTIPWMCHPQGRLSLSSGKPVQSSGVSGVNTIYYVPYTGPGIPIYNGIVWQNYCIISQLTLILNTSQHLSGNLYDVFAFINSGTLTLACGPAWTNTTTRSAGITQVGGLWTNTSSINLTANGSTFSGIAANIATYLGTFYATANGQTTHFCGVIAGSGGAAPTLGLYNAYNQVIQITTNADSFGTYTYTSSSTRAANNSTNNVCRWVDGLQQSTILGTYQQQVQVVATNGLLNIGWALDGTSNYFSVAYLGNIANVRSTITATSQAVPRLGFHYIQAVESSDGANANEFNINGSSNGENALILSLMM